MSQALIEQIEAMRIDMRAVHEHEMGHLAALDRALLEDDVALRREIDRIAGNHSHRRADILASLMDLAARIGRGPAMQARDVIEAPPAANLEPFPRIVKRAS